MDTTYLKTEKTNPVKLTEKKLSPPRGTRAAISKHVPQLAEEPFKTTFKDKQPC